MFYQNHLIPQIKPHAYGMPRSKIDRFWLIHKLASIKSYIACQHRHCASHQITSFVICESCQCVSEIVNAGFDPTLYGLAQNGGLNDLSFDQCHRCLDYVLSQPTCVLTLVVFNQYSHVIFPMPDQAERDDLEISW